MGHKTLIHSELVITPQGLGKVIEQTKEEIRVLLLRDGAGVKYPPNKVGYLHIRVAGYLSDDTELALQAFDELLAARILEVCKRERVTQQDILDVLRGGAP